MNRLEEQEIKPTMACQKKPKIIRDKLKDEIIIETWTLFETESEKKVKKRSKMKKIIKDKTVRDIMTLFEQ